MITEQEKLLGFLGGQKRHFEIPVFQRVYSWEERQCETLWRDTLRAGRHGDPHFVGTVLCTKTVNEDGGEVLEVIDGQQRLTTLTLFIAAYASRLRDEDDESRADKLKDTYITSVDESGTESCKLLLSLKDRETLEALVLGHELPEEPSSRVLENFQFFKGRISDGSCERDLVDAGLACLEAIIAYLEEDDRPQLVFESLNSKGLPLSNDDLIRNALLSASDYDEQARLYQTYWRPIEQLFEGPNRDTRLLGAIHAWLAVKFSRAHIHDQSEVYGVFRDYLQDEYKGSLEDLLKSLLAFCESFAGDRFAAMRGMDKVNKWIGRDPDALISEKKLFGD
jgi:uncharacterized protein with ParB-like and HNH nuclease domain